MSATNFVSVWCWLTLGATLVNVNGFRHHPDVPKVKRMRIVCEPRLLVFMLAAIASNACATTQTTATIRVPATIPLRTFPMVLIVPSDEPESRSLAGRLAEALDSSRTQASVTNEQSIQSRRAARTLPVASVIVYLSTRLRAGFTSRTTRRNETVCGRTGCFSRPRTVLVQIPTLHGDLVLAVVDGPSGTHLQQTRLEANVQGGTVDVLLRNRVMAELGSRLAMALDAHNTEVRIALLPVSLDGMDDALLLLQNGKWGEGRRRIEALGAGAAGLEAGDKAAYYYNLALALRFEGQGEAAWMSFFERAEDALRNAIQLDPRVRYDNALQALQNHRSQLQTLAAQDDAAEHNFRLGMLPPPPPPPPGYLRNTE